MANSLYTAMPCPVTVSPATALGGRAELPII